MVKQSVDTTSEVQRLMNINFPRLVLKDRITPATIQSRLIHNFSICKFENYQKNNYKQPKGDVIDLS